MVGLLKYYKLGTNSIYGYIDYMPINMPLWYIRDLMVLVLFSPLLYVLIKKFCLFTFVVVAIYYFIDVGPFIIHPVSVMFFLLGMILGMTHTIFIVEMSFCRDLCIRSINGNIYI